MDTRRKSDKEKASLLAKVLNKTNSLDNTNKSIGNKQGKIRILAAALSKARGYK